MTRSRRTDAKMAKCLNGVRDMLTEYGDMQPTIRHTFYKMVSRGLYEKTEREYKNLCNHLTKWRTEGAIPWSAFVDNTRWFYGATTYDDTTEYFNDVIRLYRKNLWKSQNAHVEIWTEKDAIASILLDVANKFSVKVFPTRGFSSKTALYNASMNLKEKQMFGKDLYIYYFGDYDPSGVLIDKKIYEDLENLFGVHDLHFERIAINEHQIEDYGLPTRPTKVSQHSKKFKSKVSVEIDALDPRDLQKLCEDCIVQHIDGDEWSKEKWIEAHERKNIYEMLHATKAT